MITTYGKITAVSLVNSPERIFWSTLIMIWYTLHKLLYMYKRFKRLPLPPNYQVPTHSPDVIFIILVSLLDLLGVLAGVRTPPAILKPVPHNMNILQNKKKNMTLNYKYTNICPWGMINDNQLYCVCVCVCIGRGGFNLVSSWLLTSPSLSDKPLWVVVSATWSASQFFPTGPARGAVEPAICEKHIQWTYSVQFVKCHIPASLSDEHKQQL